MRYIPTPFHTKRWQERTAYSQYLQQEAIGTRMRRWERPIHDFLAPYFRGLIERATDTPVISAEVEHRRDLDTLMDMLGYLRSLKSASEDPGSPGPSPMRNIYMLAHARESHSGSPALLRSSVGFHHSAGRQHLVPVLHWGLRKHLRTPDFLLPGTGCGLGSLSHRLHLYVLRICFRDAHADQSSSCGNGVLPGG
jgi:hypothetical protein